MNKGAVLLSAVGESNIAVINCRGLTPEEVNTKVVTALEEHYDEAVLNVDFDWEEFDNNYKPDTMEVEFEDGRRNVEVEQTWIY